MFTDIANSSELKVLMDGNTSARRDAKFRSDIKEPHDNIVLTCIEAAGGYKGNSTGDGYYFTFTDAEEAVLCALQIQERLCTNPINTPLGPLQVRIGLHTGMASPTDGDFIASTMDKAACVQSKAEPGQVWASRETHALVINKLRDVVLEKVGTFALKGLGSEDLYHAFRPGIQTSATDTPRLSPHTDVTEESSETGGGDGTPKVNPDQPRLNVEDKFAREQTHPDPTKRKMVAIVLAVLCTFGLGFALWYATRYPQTALHYWNQGQAALAQGEYIRAIALYSDALRLEPNFAQAYIGRGEAYGRKGQYDHAIADYSEAFRLDPKLVLHHAPKLATAYGSRSVAYTNRGEYDKAITDTSEAIRLDPQHAFVYASRGDAWRLKGDHDKAIADYSAAIQHDPTLASSYVGRGLSYWYKGEYDKAITDTSEAIRLDPKDARAYAARGEIYRLKAEYDKAIIDTSDAIRLDPQYAGAYAIRGWTYWHKREYDKAVTDTSDAIRLDPKDTWAYIIRGAAYLEKHEYDKAIADTSEALRLNPKIRLCLRYQGGNLSKNRRA